MPNNRSLLPEEYEFNLGIWNCFFREDPQYPIWNAIVGPWDVVALERIRESVRRITLDLGPSIPTDVFVFAFGEPSRRDVTKVGGLPYRPKNLLWPTNTNGTPKIFIAQYRFVESADIVSKLPGDILLLFGKDPYPYSGGVESYFHFEWYPIDLNNLVGKDDVPKQSWPFVKCYGTRYHTLDYLDESKAERAFLPFMPGQSLFEREFAAQAMYRIHGMKIGGAPQWFNPSDPEIRKIDGRFLCSLADIVPKIEQPYPWLNHPKPIHLWELKFPSERVLYWFDGFTCYFFLTNSGEIVWHLQLP